LITRGVIRKVVKSKDLAARVGTRKCAVRQEAGRAAAALVSACRLVGGGQNLLFLLVGVMVRDKEEAREPAQMVT
jgi:hypothetical protein